MTGTSVTMPSTAQMLLGLYGYLLPVLLYVLWSTLALWDLGRSAGRGSGGVWGWTLAIFLLPFIGPLAYFALASGQISRQVRLVAVGGGAGAYVLVLLLGAMTGTS
ncbi:MAG TPA: PLDc N-terminal domain-containing protein [Steroidobacteraceae bacterium]|nr:PLDc N-terminal domain-containing protein [Steroidobacteraceae bacterium]